VFRKRLIGRKGSRGLFDVDFYQGKLLKELKGRKVGVLSGKTF